VTAQPSLFDGPAYSPAADNERLTGQIGRVWGLMRDGGWRTLDQIADATGDPPSSISAQLRHLRKRRFGAHVVNRRNEGDGLYAYQLVPQGPLLDGHDRGLDPPAVPCPTCGSGRLHPDRDRDAAAWRRVLAAYDFDPATVPATVAQIVKGLR
jgi:hypothetical protein